MPLLTHPNPIQSSDFLIDYLSANASAFPEFLKLKSREIGRFSSPVDRLVNGLELLLAVTADPDAPNRDTALQALASASFQILAIGVPVASDRALDAIKYVRVELGEWPSELDPPSPIAVSPEYLVPAQPVMPGMPG